MHLNDQAQGLVLVHLVLAAVQGRHIGDAGVEVGRDGHDGVLGADLHSPVGVGDAVLGEVFSFGQDGVIPLFLPAQHAHGVAQDDVLVANLFGQGEGDLLHTAEHALVEDEVFVDQVGEGTCGGRHENSLQG